jgi:hypothetical protein
MTATARTRRSKVTFRSLTASASARRLATAVLEVLAGVATPTEAARSAGVSLPRYYALEARGLQAMVTGLEPKPRGRQRSVQGELAAQARENQRLAREVGRLQALVRAAHRASGLAEHKEVKRVPGRRRRRATARAVKAVAVLRQAGVSADDGAGSAAREEA